MAAVRSCYLRTCCPAIHLEDFGIAFITVAFMDCCGIFPALALISKPFEKKNVMQMKLKPADYLLD